MALVDDGTMTMAERVRHLRPVDARPEGTDAETESGTDPAGDTTPASNLLHGPSEKRVFLLTAFRHPGLTPDGGPITGMAEDVLAVIGMDGPRQRFEWVGTDQLDSIANPALITPVEVRLALPSPWHVDDPEMATGLVPLDAGQLGDGTLDEDVDHLLAELSITR